MHSRKAQRIANQNKMLSSVIVTFRMTLTIKRSIRKPAMTETAVTTCGVTIFEISQMAPITTESKVVSSMKLVQEKRRTCLGEVGCCLFLSVLFDASALMKTGVWTSSFMMIVFISELFIVSRAITRYSSTQSQVFVKLLVCGEEWLSWLLKLQKLPMVLHQVMFSLSTVGRPLTSMSKTIVPVSSV